MLVLFKHNQKMLKNFSEDFFFNMGKLVKQTVKIILIYIKRAVGIVYFSCIHVEYLYGIYII